MRIEVETREWSSWGGRAGPKEETEMHTEQALLRQWAWESKLAYSCSSSSSSSSSSSDYLM